MTIPIKIFLCCLPFLGFHKYNFEIIDFIFSPFYFLALYLCTKREKIRKDFIILAGAFLALHLLIPKFSVLEQTRALISNIDHPIQPDDFIQNPKKYTYFFSVNGSKQGIPSGRHVSAIDINDSVVSLNIGWNNTQRYNFLGNPPAFQTQSLPFVATHTINPNMVGMFFTLQGLFYINGQKRVFQKPTSYLITSKDIGKKFSAFGGDFKKSDHIPLILKLHKTVKWQMFYVLELLSKFLSLAFAILGFLSLKPIIHRYRETVTFLAFHALSLWTFKDQIAKGFMAIAGNDGFIHMGSAHAMFQNYSQGDFLTMIKSPEDIFYFMPGTRYIKLFEYFVVGESVLLTYCFMCFLPLFVYQVFRCFLKDNVAFAVALAMNIAALNFVGLSYKTVIKAFSKHYGEVYSIPLLFFALSQFYQKITTKRKGILVTLALSVAISIRPNLCPFIGLLALFYVFTSSFATLSFKDKLITCSGFLLVFLIPLHNYSFGGKLVLFTGSSLTPDNLKLTPLDYWNWFLGQGELKKFTHHLDSFYLHYLLAYGFLIYVVLKNRIKHPLTITALACLAGISMHFFYQVDIRYMHSYLLLSFLIALYQFKGLRRNEVYYPSSFYL